MPWRSQEYKTQLLPLYFRGLPHIYSSQNLRKFVRKFYIQGALSSMHFLTNRVQHQPSIVKYVEHMDISLAFVQFYKSISMLQTTLFVSFVAL